MPSSDMDGFPKKKDVDFMGLNSLGYISAQEPDGGVLKGNPRGVGSVGFQVTRTANTQVPSGGYSGAFGYNNTVSGNSSFAFGDNNTVSGARSVVFGSSNTCSGGDGLVIGSSCTNTSVTAGFSFGNSCTASGGGSMAVGASVSATAIIRRRVTGTISTNLRALVVIKLQTTNATPGVMVSNTGAAAANNQVLVADTGGSTFLSGLLVAKQSGSSNVAFWTITALLHRTGNEATTTLVTSTVTAVSNTPGWTNPSVSADTTNGRVSVTVTGVAATNIRWVASIKSIEAKY